MYCQEKCKKLNVCEKDVWNPAICNCKNGKYLASITNDSGIIFYEVIDLDADAEAKLNSKTNFKESNYKNK